MSELHHPSHPFEPSLGARRFAIIPSGPPLRSEQLELRQVLTAEVAILWAGDVLSVTHVSLPGEFSIGESSGAGQRPCDFYLPQEKLGATSRKVLVGNRNRIQVILPEAGAGYLRLPDGGMVNLDEAGNAAFNAGAGRLEGSGGGQLLPLARGCRVHLQFGDLEVQVAAVSAGRPPIGSWAQRFDPTVLAYFGLSALSFGGLLSTMALWVPPLGLARNEDFSAEDLYLIQQFLAASAERNRTAEVAVEASSTRFGATSSASAAREAGQAGKEAVKARRHRPRQILSDNLRPELSRAEQLQEAQNSGIIGLLAQPTVPSLEGFFGDREGGVEGDPSWMGDMFSPGVGLGMGSGGLALTGTGQGGGQKGDSVGMGGVRIVGRGRNNALGTGSSAARAGRGVHRVKSPKLRASNTKVSGRIPAATIRRTIHLQHPRLVGCYQMGLLTDPALAGRVVVRFVIDSRGSVSTVGTSGSDLASSAVLKCITRVFYGLSFPKPQGGIVTVQYPLNLQPD